MTDKAINDNDRVHKIIHNYQNDKGHTYDLLLSTSYREFNFLPYVNPHRLKQTKWIRPSSHGDTQKKL